MPDSEPVGVGINQPRRGFADVGDEQMQVIFKSIPEDELAAEIFCAILARELALPVPEPLLLFSPVTGAYLFGSVDMQYPNSLRAFNIDPLAPDMSFIRQLTELIVSWSKVKDVAAFDEWIHNKDRNLGNLLFAGNNEFILIDHGKSLDIDPDFPSNNWICAILANDCKDERAKRALIKSMQSTASTFDMMHAEAPRAKLESDGILSHTSYAERFYQLVEDRLSLLATLLQNRLPGQQGLMMPDTN